MKNIFLILLLCPLISFGQFLNPQGTQLYTSGTTVTVSNGVGLLNVNPASLIASLTITLPSTPNDKDVCQIQFGGTIASGTSVITLLSITSAAGILGVAPATAISGASMTWVYNAIIGKWFRLT